MPGMGRSAQTLVAQVRWSLRQRGVRGTLGLMWGRFRGRERSGSSTVHPFDAQYGVETSGLIGGAELPGGHAHDVYSTAYFGVPPSRMRLLLEVWQRSPGVRPLEEYAFLDVGCGKGRALLLASELPFREVVGVELSPELAEIADRNAKIWAGAGRARSGIRVECADATEVELPRGPLLIYFYNSFRAPVLRRFLGRLEEWAERGGEPVDMLCLFPEEEWVFAEFPRFERIWSERIGLAAEDTGIDGVSEAEDPCSAYRRGI